MFWTWSSDGEENDSGSNEIGTSKSGFRFSAIAEQQEQTSPCLGSSRNRAISQPLVQLVDARRRWRRSHVLWRGEKYMPKSRQLGGGKKAGGKEADGKW